MAKIRVTKDGSLRTRKCEPYCESQSPYPSWEAFCEANRLRPCANPACNNRRHNRGQFCASCSRYNTLFGNPKYRPVNRKQYKKEIAQAEDMIAFNMKNIVVTDFVDKFTTLAYQGKEELPIEWASWWGAIHDILINPKPKFIQTPHKLLAELVGVYIFYDRTGGEFIKTDKMWNYTLGSIALRGVKMHVRPRASIRRMQRWGRYIWDIFSIYFIKIGRALMQNENLQRIREQQLAEAELELPEEQKRDG